MSGLLGLCTAQVRHDLDATLAAMAAAITHRGWHRVHSYSAAHVRLGRLEIGLFNQTPQPALGDNGVAAMFCGELYDTASWANDLSGLSPEQVILRLYQRGELRRAAPLLRGPFVAAVWDPTEQRLTLLNDRFARYPLFYARSSGAFVFAPEMKAVLCSPNLDKRTSAVALAEYVRFQRLLGTKTFFESIELLPAAAILEYDARRDDLRIQRYWDFEQIATPPAALTFDDAVSETSRLLRRAIARVTAGPLRTGVYLSGGLDSRLVAGMARRERAFPTLTYGAANSADVVFARRIAHRLGTPHHVHPFDDGRWVLDSAPLHLSLTEGLHAWVHMHGIDTLPRARELMDVNLTGYMGDQLLGGQTYAIAPEMAQAPDDLAFETALFEACARKLSWPGFQEAEARTVFARCGADTNALAWESLRREAAGFRRLPAALRTEAWAIDNHSNRLTHLYAVFTRSHIEVRYPFCDEDLAEFLLGLPLSMRLDHRLQRAVLHRELPRLATLPSASDFLPPATGWRRSTLEIRNAVRYRWRGHPPSPVRLYADYEAWLRTDLRSWAETLLLGERTLDRGVFAPDCVRSLWRRHLGGNELHTIGRLAPLMSFEMAMRLLVDGLPPAVAAGVEPGEP